MIFLFIFLFTSFLAFPQDNLNIQYLSHYVYDSELSDIWGYSDGVRELAIVGVYDGISVVDVIRLSAMNALSNSVSLFKFFSIIILLLVLISAKPMP